MAYGYGIKLNGLLGFTDRNICITLYLRRQISLVGNISVDLALMMLSFETMALKRHLGITSKGRQIVPRMARLLDSRRA